MEKEVTSAIIGAGGALIGVIINTVVNRRQSIKILRESRTMSQQAKDDHEIILLKEKRKDLLRKLNDFFLPLNNLLEQSKHFYDEFILGKPEGFRTLIYLLDPDQEYVGNKVVLSQNDKVFLEEVFRVGKEIENLITNKKWIIDDEEFIGNYKPGPGYTDIQFDNNISLLGLLQHHLRVIRTAYAGNLKGEMEKLSKFVYPRELNKRVTDKIIALQAEVKICEEKIKKVIS